MMASPVTNGQTAPGGGSLDITQKKITLQEQIDKYASHPLFTSNPPVRVESSKRSQRFEKLIDLAIPEFLGNFPIGGQWNKELTHFAEALLTIFYNGTLRLHGIFSVEELRERTWLIHLVSFIRRMDEWSSREVESVRETPTPTELADRAIETASSLLICLGLETAGFRDNWARFHNVIQRLLQASKDITTPGATQYPYKKDLLNVAADEPDSDPFEETKQKRPNIEITSQIGGQNLGAAIVEIVVRTIVHPLPGRLFLDDVISNSLAIACQMAHSVLDSTEWASSSAAPLVKARRVIQSLVLLLEDRTVITSTSPAPQVLCRLLNARVSSDDDTGSPELEIVDGLLLRGIDALPSETIFPTYVPQFADVLVDNEWGSLQSKLKAATITYLRKARHVVQSSVVSYVQRSLERAPHPGDPALDILRHEYSDAAVANLGDRNNGKRKRDTSWRDECREALTTLLKPTSDVWARAESFDDFPWLNAVLRTLQDRFSGPVSEQLTVRETLAESLARFTGLLRPTNLAAAHDSPPKSEMLFDVLSAAQKALSDHETSMQHSTILCHVYASLADGVFHASSDSTWLVRVLDSGRRGLVHPHRAVRVAAGKIFLSVIQHLQSSNELEKCDLVLGRLSKISDEAPQTTREVVVMTLGWIGKIANPDLLGRVIIKLVTQWSQPSILLRALAFTSLKEVARERHHTPYTLVAPYLRQLSIYVTANITSTPSLLNELARFLSRPLSQILDLTLSHSLPSLVVTSSRDEIIEVARLLHRPVAAMLIEKTIEIMKAIFLLEDDQTSADALDFLTSLLEETSQTVSKQSLVFSYLQKLLGELVMELGSDKERSVRLALKALERVEETIYDRKHNGKDDGNLGSFLTPHMLGIMNYLDDELMEMNGRRSPGHKRQVIRSIGKLIQIVGAPISATAPQIMAAMQQLLPAPEVTQVTIETWGIFMTNLSFADIGPYIGSTAAAFVHGWQKFDRHSRDTAISIMTYLFIENLDEIKDHIPEVVNLRYKDLSMAQSRIDKVLQDVPAITKLEYLLQRCSNDNINVATLSLHDLNKWLNENQKTISSWASGDVFHPILGTIVQVLLAASARDGDLDHRVLALESWGLLGAPDPDRFEPSSDETLTVVLHDFKDEDESIAFALHLVSNLLVGAFRSTSDLRYQNNLAFAIQELLKFCKFTPDLIKNNGKVPVKIHNKWNSLPQHIVDAITPLLESKYTHGIAPSTQYLHPLFPAIGSYREWVQQWASFLITRTSGKALQIFGSTKFAVRSQDAEVARYLLPHLVLNVLLSSNDHDSESIRSEILAVLTAQAESAGEKDDRLLYSAQTIFEVMDHMSSWIRQARQLLTRRKAESRRRSDNSAIAEEKLSRVDSLMTSIDGELLATAALQCKAYARALMTLEGLVIANQERNATEEQLQPYYDRLHLVYASLEEPDGMEGLSAKMTSPSLDHRIREHESTGRWTSAQSCWELKLQQAPDDMNIHMGFLRCLKNLGHHDTLLTHIKGIINRHPQWEVPLSGLHAESAAKVGDWTTVRTALEITPNVTSETSIAKLLLALNTGNTQEVSTAFRETRLALGTPLTSGRRQSYRTVYNTIVDLCFVHELRMIHTYDRVIRLRPNEAAGQVNKLMVDLGRRLAYTQPFFSVREPMLAMRRIGLQMSSIPQSAMKREIGQAWGLSAKLARKAGYAQTAYTANLQASHWGASFAFIESCKLLRTTDNSLQALQELTRFLKPNGESSQSQNSSAGSGLTKLRGKAVLLQARWMHESERYSEDEISSRLKEASRICENWDSPWYYLGTFYDEWIKSGNGKKGGQAWVSRAHYSVILSYYKALINGSKYTYQIVPRLLTLWLDPAEHPLLVHLEGPSRPSVEQDVLEAELILQKTHKVIEQATNTLPPYQWMTAFPQILSRMGHPLPSAYSRLSDLIVHILSHYPQQGLWYFTPVVLGKLKDREVRGRKILDRAREVGSSKARQIISKLINEWTALTKEFLHLSDLEAKDPGEIDGKRLCPALYSLLPISLMLPTQDSLTVSMPPSSTLGDTVHHPFPINAPTFHTMEKGMLVMPSLVRPKRVTITGNDGCKYSFLCKPKDDLRKDARLMDFFSMINKFLNASSESRRRRLHIKTYAVLPLNELCGLIEWVPNVTTMRSILMKLYDSRGLPVFKNAFAGILDEARAEKRNRAEKEVWAAEQFVKVVLPMYPPVFHEWFLATWPEPGAWLSSRLAYSRSSAVMAMVGSILGLGDRHGENILLNGANGEVLHVDFNCLFDKGKHFEVPERVPFRLTQNVVDGFGVTDVEGVFRHSAEITMELLRTNKDSLANVLEAFVHDPLVEWQDEKNKKDREMRQKQSARLKGQQQQRPTIALKDLGEKYLGPMERRLSGYTGKEGAEKVLGVPAHVETLIKEARDPQNFAMMYPGWASWL
ncbi:hypothetical protein DL93DRAFT_2155621 [Clavulina sp. PMI_390]|nr:hypothetical protein DL93DRAFT_2155621 [Clavulina sp. PMI_390]